MELLILDLVDKSNWYLPPAKNYRGTERYPPSYVENLPEEAEVNRAWR